VFTALHCRRLTDKVKNLHKFAVKYRELSLSQKLKSLDKEALKEASVYLAKLVGVYATWKIFIYIVEHNEKSHAYYNHFRDEFAHVLLIINQFIIKVLFGMDVHIHERITWFDGTKGIYLGNSCIGLAAMVIFAGIIMSFPGKIKHKLWFIPLGMILVQGSNMFRITGLTMLQRYSTEAFVQFNHGYTYVIITYSFMFFLIVFWMNKFGLPEVNKGK
jgi:exosortase/archaeosortase family protein